MTDYDDFDYDEPSSAPRKSRRLPNRRAEASADTQRVRGFSTHSAKVSIGQRGSSRQVRGPRVVVKANFRRGAKATATMKASARYYLTRENAQGEEMMRDGFDQDRDDLSKKDMYLHIQENSDWRTYQYRFVIAPETDADAQGVDMRTFTRQVMDDLNAQLRANGAAKDLTWVAVNHSGDEAHTEHGHTHVLAQLPVRMDREDFESFRFQARLTFNHMLNDLHGLEQDTAMEHGVHSFTQTYGGNLDEMVTSDLYFDAVENGGGGTLNAALVNEFYEKLAERAPEYFEEGQFRPELFEQAMKQHYVQTEDAEAYKQSYGVSEEEKHRFVSEYGGSVSDILAAQRYLEAQTSHQEPVSDATSGEASLKDDRAILKDFIDDFASQSSRFGPDVDLDDERRSRTSLHLDNNLDF